MYRTALFAALSVTATAGAAVWAFGTEGPAPPEATPAPARRLVPLKAAALPAEATWVLRSDVRLDGRLDGSVQTDRLALKAERDRLRGGYTGQRAQGKENRSRFTGEVTRAPAGGAVLTLRQQDRWYVACYAGRLTGENRFTGSWFDSDGRAGDFELAATPN